MVEDLSFLLIPEDNKKMHSPLNIGLPPEE